MATAVIAAGGTGVRFGRADGKQLVEVAGAPLVGHTLVAFEESRHVSSVVLVVDPDRIEVFEQETVARLGLRKVVAVVGGGDTRQVSVERGLEAVSGEEDVVAVHDGARPLITPETIDGVVSALADAHGVDGLVVGHPVFDTLKAVDGDEVTGTPDRAGLWVAQTPQVFWARALLEAYASAAREGFQGTDDASLVSWAGGVVRMYAGSRDNIKATVEEDLEYVGHVLESRRRARGATS
jgi:2-C-methyl-D-erythritol 4-phosphate cytidylyltransferase